MKGGKRHHTKMARLSLKTHQHWTSFSTECRMQEKSIVMWGRNQRQQCWRITIQMEIEIVLSDPRRPKCLFVWKRRLWSYWSQASIRVKLYFKTVLDEWKAMTNVRRLNWKCPGILRYPVALPLMYVRLWSWSNPPRLYVQADRKVIDHNAMTFLECMKH